MTISNKRLDAIVQADLLELVADDLLGRKSLEFKSELPGHANREQKEFLQEVASFSNASGGDLICGIKEADRQIVETAGLEVEDLAAEKLRIENLILNGIEPRIPGLRIHGVQMSGSRHVFILRIPRSVAGPHWVKFGESRQFYSRTSTGKYLLDYEDLRQLFAVREDRVKQLHSFRVERLGRIIAGETTVPLKNTPKVVMHVFPMFAIDPSKSVPLSAIPGLEIQQSWIS